MNRLTLAVAGGRKTQSIVDDCSAAAPDQRALILTYTQANQDELRSRLSRTGPRAGVVEVQGWFSFLLGHWIRPYLPLRFADARLRGLNFEGDPGRFATGQPRFLDQEQRAYRRHLAHLAYDVNVAAGGAPVDRLARLYDVIYVDEVQDLNGWDLEILATLLTSPIRMTMVGDIRQAILFTNVQDPKNSQFKGIKVIDWFRAEEKAGRLQIVVQNTTWRCSQAIAELADAIIDDSWGFAATKSNATDPGGHTGLYSVPIALAERYVETFKPLCLRSRADMGGECELPYVNIGNAKGMESGHVLIWPTRPMLDCLRKGKALKTQSSCALYVAVTRARASVAFITDTDVGLPRWSPT